MTALRVAIGLIGHQGRYFLQRRDPAAVVLPGVWEFPGGKLKPRESPLDGLLRELREELDWSPEAVSPLPRIRHAYPDREVELHPFLCRGTLPAGVRLAWGWFTPGEMSRLILPEANAPLIDILGNEI
jgi:mutator protein MutT